jgi:hypothetical protein
MRLLFVGGPQRSGTTALVHYLNLHPEVMLCMERYKWVGPRGIRPELFTVERILDYSLRPGRRKQETDTPRQYHAELLASKDPEQLKWIGDKNPSYVRNLDWLAENNPGASFILTYRPLDEVAESWEARQKDPEDSWRMGGFEAGVDFWNTAMRSTRDFIKNAINLNVLILSYHDFFYDSQAGLPLLSRFLDIEIDQGMRDAWGEMLRGFETGRRPKQPLSEEQRAYIEMNKDSEAERWVLDHIQRQRQELELYTPHAARALAKERRRSAVRVARERQESRRSRGQVERLRERNRDLERQLQAIRSSRSWRLLNTLNHIRVNVSKRLNGSNTKPVPMHPAQTPILRKSGSDGR